MQLSSTPLLTTLLLPLTAFAAPQISIHPSLSSLIPSFSLPTPTLPSVSLPPGIGLPKRAGMQHVKRQLPSVSIHPSLSSLIPSFSLPTPTFPSIDPSLIPSFSIPTPTLPSVSLPPGIGLPKRARMQHVQRQLPSISIHPSLSSLIPSFSLPTVTAPPLPTVTAPGTCVGTGGTVSATGFGNYYANGLKQVKREDLEDDDDQRDWFERMMG